MRRKIQCAQNALVPQSSDFRKTALGLGPPRSDPGIRKAGPEVWAATGRGVGSLAKYKGSNPLPPRHCPMVSFFLHASSIDTERTLASSRQASESYVERRGFALRYTVSMTSFISGLIFLTVLREIGQRCSCENGPRFKGPRHRAIPTRLTLRHLKTATAMTSMTPAAFL
ncbi:hypothetical protein EV714DRAFT_240597, partial [Schizophyllum commune]